MTRRKDDLGQVHGLRGKWVVVSPGAADGLAENCNGRWNMAEMLLETVIEPTETEQPSDVPGWLVTGTALEVGVPAPGPVLGVEDEDDFDDEDEVFGDDDEFEEGEDFEDEDEDFLEDDEEEVEGESESDDEDAEEDDDEEF
jgi:hypothetical protein